MENDSFYRKEKSLDPKLIDTLLTYLPYSRISDIPNYFEKNVSAIRPKRSIVYVDGIRAISDGSVPRSILTTVKEQVNPSFELRTGNWMDRNSCLMRIFMDLKSDVSFENLYIIDSDNLLEPSFQEIDSLMERASFDFYAVMDKTIKSDANFIKRSRLVYSQGDLQVWSYRIFRRSWKSPFFIGPKQGIRMSKRFIDSLNTKTIAAISDSMNSIEPVLRNYIADEHTLGMMLYSSGISFTPWIKHGSHIQGIRSSQTDYLLHGLVHSYLGKNMMKRQNVKGMRWYYLRNKVAFMTRSLFV